MNSNLIKETDKKIENAVNFFAKSNLSSLRAENYNNPEVLAQLTEDNIKSIVFSKTVTSTITVNLINGNKISKVLMEVTSL